MRKQALRFGVYLGAVAVCGLLTLIAPQKVAAASSDGVTAAQTDAQSYDELWSLLRLSDLVDILREEGSTMAIQADVDLLGRAGGDPWRARVHAIYDADQLLAETVHAMEAALSTEHLDALCDFYKSDDMQTVVDLEITARRAFLDADIEERARSAWLSGRAVTPHEDAIFHFVKVNDLVERNVMGALNSNYAFLRALTDADPQQAIQLTDQEILSEVWSQEVEIRRDTSEWLFAFLTTAYGPVSDEVLNAYVTFSETDAGHALNHAMFEAFDNVYIRLSSDLGRAVGEIGAQQDL